MLEIQERTVCLHLVVPSALITPTLSICLDYSCAMVERYDISASMDSICLSSAHYIPRDHSLSFVGDHKPYPQGNGGKASLHGLCGTVKC